MRQSQPLAFWLKNTGIHVNSLMLVQTSFRLESTLTPSKGTGNQLVKAAIVVQHGGTSRVLVCAVLVAALKLALLMQRDSVTIQRAVAREVLFAVLAVPRSLVRMVGANVVV